MTKVRLMKFRALRKERGINLDAIATKLHVSKAYISMIETGKRSLDYEMAIIMANMFGIKPDELFFDDVANSLAR